MRRAVEPSETSNGFSGRVGGGHGDGDNGNGSSGSSAGGSAGGSEYGGSSRGFSDRAMDRGGGSGSMNGGQGGKGCGSGSGSSSSTGSSGSSTGGSSGKGREREAEEGSGDRVGGNYGGTAHENGRAPNGGVRGRSGGAGSSPHPPVPGGGLDHGERPSSCLAPSLGGLVPAVIPIEVGPVARDTSGGGMSRKEGGTPAKRRRKSGDGTREDLMITNE